MVRHAFWNGSSCASTTRGSSEARNRPALSKSIAPLRFVAEPLGDRYSWRAMPTASCRRGAKD
jgi:hypothetical protein